MAEPLNVFDGTPGPLLIVWVDDEPGLVTPWRAAVAAAFGNEHLSFHTTVRDTVRALDAARETRPQPRPFLIWDMMLPTEPGMDAQAVSWGTRTGRVMWREYRERFPSSPAVLLSHISDFRILEEFGRGHFDRAWIKSSTTPEMLVQWVREMAVAAYGSEILDRTAVRSAAS